LFGALAARAGDRLVRGRLTVQVLPFSDQPGYDRLLWACDLNFVRGEDSLVRALWAGRPLVWQIYPQAEDAHQIKLAAFWARYRTGLDAGAANALQSLWQGWNGAGPTDWPARWEAFAQARPALAAHASAWAGELASRPDLAFQLVEFAEKVTR
jgi:uncharacterized repeat protein (TIGR03837 family)